MRAWFVWRVVLWMPEWRSHQGVGVGAGWCIRLSSQRGGACRCL